MRRHSACCRVVLALTLRAASAVAEPVDVLERGATGDGRTDDTAAIQTAVDSTKDTGGEVYLPAGTYLVTAPIGLYARSVYRGAGAGATALVTPTSGPGFPVFRVATPRRCAEGNGACDGAIGARRRGAGCVCYDDDDCARGACAGGTVQRRLALRDLEIRLRTSNAVGVDAALIGESTISNVSIVASDGTAGTVGMVFSDGNGKVSGYSDTVTECHVLGLERGVVFLPRANDHRLIANVIERGSVAVVIRPTVNATHIISNLLQSFASRGIEDHGDGTCIIGNRFEARAPHIALEADGSDAQVVANYHGGAGAPIQDAGMKDALVLETTRGAAARGALGNMAFDALSWAPRASAPFACSAARDGSTYFDAGLHRLCLCDGSRATWCPLQVERDALGCGSATACR